VTAGDRALDRKIINGGLGSTAAVAGSSMNYRMQSEAEFEAEASRQLPMEVVDALIHAPRELRPRHTPGRRQT